MKKQTVALVLGLLIAGCSSDQNEQSTGVAQSALVTQTVYTNGVLTSGWTDYSNATRNLNSGTVLHSGLRTLSVTYKAYKWIAFTRSNGVSGNDAISFYVYGGANTTSLNVHMELLIDGNWVYGPQIAPYCTGGKIPKNTWVFCQVPFSSFGASSSTTITGFSFDENAGRSWSTVAFSTIQLLNTVSNGTGGATSTGGSSSNGGSSVIGGSSSVGGSTTSTSTVAGGTASLGGSSANGGSSTIGGSNALGGETSLGGSTTVSGGTSSVGGSSTSVGGAPAEGGASSVGGSSTLGGSTASGGSSTVGGTTSTGGTTSDGGTSAIGGFVSTGGTSSIGGSSSTGGGTSLGCLVSGQPTGEFHLSVKDGVGTDRDFLVIVPTSYIPSTPRSLFFGFHGAGGTYDTPRYYGFLEVPDAVADTIYIFPQGVPYRDLGVGWDDSCNGYDMVFFDNMLAKIESMYCIDTKRVYAAGFSWGCDFVTGLACCRGDKIRGIGAASCSDDFSRSGDFTSYLYLPCPTVNHAGIRFTHDLNGDWGYNADQMTMTSHLYRYFNGCSENSSTVSTSCVSYNGCAEPVVDCDYPGMGHWMPPNWASETWSFFMQLP